MGRVTDKLTPVTDNIFCCRSGSAADTQAITDVVKYRLNFMEIDQVWTVPVGGMCVRQPVSIGGSGSTFLYGMMDHMYREKMPQEECEKLVLQMVTQAIRRDGSSGGCCRIATITKNGVERKLFLNNELPTTW